MLDSVGEAVAWIVVVRSAVFRDGPSVRGLGEVGGCWLLGGTVGRWGDPEVGAGAE